MFIDTGNLATNLAEALYWKRLRIVQVYSCTEEPVRELVQKVEAEYTTSLGKMNSYTKLYIISLKDFALAGLLPTIVTGKRKEASMTHTVGSIPVNIWEGHASHYGMFYPMQAFSKQREADSKEISFLIEASSTEGTVFLKAIAPTLSNRVYDAGPEQRKSLHLAAVFTHNFTSHVYALAVEPLKKYNLPFGMMLSLTNEATRKAHELEPRVTQTRPAIRCDENVVGNHLRVLTDDPRT